MVVFLFEGCEGGCLLKACISHAYIACLEGQGSCWMGSRIMLEPWIQLKHDQRIQWISGPSVSFGADLSLGQVNRDLHG